MAETTDTDAPKAESRNTVAIEDVGPCLKRLKIEVPAETVDEKLGDSLDTLAVEAQLPGFRKGRVPRRLIEKKFGADVRTEAKNQLIAAAYSEAIEDHSLKVIGEPTSEGIEGVEVLPGRPLIFEVEVEVQPEFDVPAFDGIEVKKPMLEVAEDDVTAEIEKIRLNEGRLETLDAPDAGDYITGTGIMTGDDDGHEFYNIPGAVVRVPLPEDNGKGMILGIMVDDLAEQLGLPRAGETATIKAIGPENHEVEKLRNAKVTITFAVDRIDRIIPAELGQIIESFGMTDEDQLKSAVRVRMEQRVAIQQHAAMRQQIATRLLEGTQFDLPKRVTAAQAARNLERRRLELMHRGVDPQEIERHMAELRAASSTTAVQELKLFFIIHKIAEDLQIKVEDAEINGRIAQMAAERNDRPERLRQELIQNNRLGLVYLQIREHKTMDAILAKSKIEEIPAAEFNRLVEQGAIG